MEPAQPSITDGYLSLKEAAEALNVSIETLLEWNDNNILKPTITLSGDVAYKQEQIDKFLAIQQLSKDSKIHLQEKTPQSQTFAVKPAISGVNSETPDVKRDVGVSKKRNSNLHSPGLVLSFFVVLVSLLTISLVQQHKSSPSNSLTIPSSDQTKNVESVSTSDINKVNLLGSSSNSIYVPLLNKDAFKNNLNEGSTSQENKLAAEYLSAETHNATTAAKFAEEKPNVQVLGNSDSTFGTFTNLSSRANCPTCTDNTQEAVFDDKGNIKGENSTDTLATIFGSTGNIQGGTSLRRTAIPSLYLTFSIIVLLLATFLFVVRPAYLTSKSTSHLTLSNTDSAPMQKVLEIDQKGDGSVVLYFQGEEHKISKPELNSETDQFIQRLLGFAGKDAKEINYNILKDEKIRLNAPLSKLVTRLGFVGLKRDLFFPRTSKNRVIFRKYITHQDLVSLGLTPTQISEELLN